MRTLKASVFTLVEMLMVIAVIVILSSLLLPALNKTREKARDIGCRNNLKQVGLGLSYYAMDYNGYMPAVKNGSVYWYALAGAYISKTPAGYKIYKAMICPSSAKEYEAESEAQVSRSYMASDTLRGADDDWALPVREKSAMGSSALYCIDGAKVGDYYCNSGQGWSNTPGVVKISYRHLNKANALFADMHVNSVSDGTLTKAIWQGTQ